MEVSSAPRPASPPPAAKVKPAEKSRPPERQAEQKTESQPPKKEAPKPPPVVNTQGHTTGRIVNTSA